MIAVPFQHRGYAREGGLSVAAWLEQQGAAVLRAKVHPDNEASRRVARALGMTPTVIGIDGETRWQRRFGERRSSCPSTGHSKS